MPDLVVIAPEGWPEGSVTEGADAWRLQAQRLRDSWREARVAVEEIRPVGEDRVVVAFRYITRGDDPAIAFDTPMAAAFFLRAGRIVRAHYFWTIEDAMEEARSADPPA